MMTRSTSDAEATQALARRLAGAIHHAALPITIWLLGEIGGGKTTFAQGMIAAMGWSGQVKSPTYSLVEAYDTPCGQVFHFDFYRVRDAAELANIGIRDYFNEPALLLIEWADRMSEILPSPDVTVRFMYDSHSEDSASQRRIIFTSGSATGEELSEQLS